MKEQVFNAGKTNFSYKDIDKCTYIMQNHEINYL